MKAYDVKKGNVIEHNGGAWQVRDLSTNGTFLNGITRQRILALLRADGLAVEETPLWEAEHPEMAVLRRAAATTAADNAARLVVMSIRMI